MVENLRAKITEAAAFLDDLAHDIEPHPWMDEYAADCRAMARKLRGET